MFNEQIRQRLQEFLTNKVEDYANTDMCYLWHEDEDDYDGYDDYSDLAAACHADHYRNGVSKIVLFYDELHEWVIKVPIMGNYYEEEDYHEDFVASGYDSGNDYCRTEVEYCQEAINRDLAGCFALTFFVCTINDIPFYCSERIAKEYHDVYKSIQRIDYKKPNSLNYAKCICNSYARFEVPLTEKILAIFVDNYDEDIASQLVDFLVEYHIDDLHLGNLGLDSHNQIKIIDCAGWRD